MNDVEGEFFLAGARTYLDVNDAMAEFRRYVQRLCAKAVTSRMRDVNRASQMNWTTADLKDYLWTDGYHIGKQLAVNGLGGLYFCLELSRSDGGVCYASVVYFYRERGSFASELWEIIDDNPSDIQYCEGNNLVFTHKLTDDQLPDFQTWLDRTIDEFVAFIEAAGGLKKHLPPQ